MLTFRRGSLLGVVFGALLWLVAHFVFQDNVPALLSQTLALPWVTSHLLYGAVLGLLVQRNQ